MSGINLPREFLSSPRPAGKSSAPHIPAQNQPLDNHDHHPDCHIFGGEGNEKTDKKPLCPAGNLFTSLGIFSHTAGFQITENTITFTIKAPGS